MLGSSVNSRSGGSTNRADYGGSSYDQQNLSNTDLQNAAYYRSLAESGAISWDRANSLVNNLRASYGYTGGADGSAYLPVSGAAGSGAAYNTTPSISSTRQTSYENLIRQQKAAELEASLANLKNAYEQNMNGYRTQAGLLPQTYETARNAAATQNAIAGRDFDERAIAMGLSSGARGQAQLSRSAAYQSALSGIGQQQANAQSALALDMANEEANYNNTVANAKAQNSAALSDALYKEYIRQTEEQQAEIQRQQAYLTQLAETAAGYGDYSFLNQLGIDTSSYEAQQAALSAQAAAEANAYKPTFTAAQVISEANNAAKNGTQLMGNMLRDYNYYMYGDPNYGIGDTSAAIGALIGNGGAATGGKTIDQIAQEVIAGKWGNGDARKSALAAAGYDAAAVQARVNQLMPSTPTTPSAQEITTPTGGGLGNPVTINDLANYDAALGNYAGVRDKAAEIMAQNGKDAVLSFLREAYRTGVLTLGDYSRLYNQYRG